MSVQVRRRREAASFLQSFVGAQGELLVDTTNNRVQVHDGVTPGGFAAASTRDMPGFNLGINTNGAINQRGVSGTVTLSAGQYGHDRHKAGANGCTYTFSTAASGDTTFTITAGSLIQAVDTPNVFSTAMWLTWTGTAAARVYQGAASSAPALGAGVAVPIPADGVTVNAIQQSGLTLGTITFVEFGTGTLNTTRPWQLEAALSNAGPARLARRHGELAICQRYYWRRPSSGSLDILGMAQAYSATTLFGITVSFPATMRASPTIGLSAVTHISGFSAAGGGPFAFSSGGPAYVNPTSLAFNLSGAPSGSFVAGNAVMCCFNTASAWFDLSAEL